MGWGRLTVKEGEREGVVREVIMEKMMGENNGGGEKSR